jgi:hypothetical protein
MTGTTKRPIDQIRDYIRYLRSDNFRDARAEQDTPPESVPAYPLSWILEALHDDVPQFVPGTLGMAIMVDAADILGTQPSNQTPHLDVAQVAERIAGELERVIQSHDGSNLGDDRAWLQAVLRAARDCGCDPYRLIGEALLSYGAQVAAR